MGGSKRLTMVLPSRAPSGGGDPAAHSQTSIQHSTAHSTMTYCSCTLLAMGQKNTLILAFVKHLWKLFLFLLYRSKFLAWGENKNQ